MKHISIHLLLLLFLVSCGNEKKKMNKKVKELEVQVQKNFSKDNANQLVASYNKFIIAFPEDTSCKGFMVNGAEISLLEQDSEKALKFINEFLKTYPDDSRAGIMQFKKALVYDLLLHDGLRAVAEYDIFIKNYPEHPFKNSAKNAILLIQNPETFMATITKGQDSTNKANKSQEN